VALRLDTGDEDRLHSSLSARRRAMIFYNSRSGGNLDRGASASLDSVRDALEREAWSYTCCALSDEAVRDLPNRLLVEKPSVLVVIGGDGSIRSLLPAAIASNTPLLIVPSGTMNLLARSLNIPFDPAEAASLVGGGRVATVDLARVNGELYSCHAMLGRSPHLTRLRERLRGRGIASGLGVFLRILRREIRRNGRSLFQVRSVRGKRWLRAHTLVIANNLVDQSSPLGLVKPRLDEAVLGLYTIAPATTWSWLRFLVRWLFGFRRKSPDAGIMVSPAFTLRTWPASVLLSLDGEPVRLQSPLAFVSMPRALQVVVPAETRVSP
jgi:diacylglycerol kinase family enzyme